MYFIPEFSTASFDPNIDLSQQIKYKTAKLHTNIDIESIVDENPT